MKTRTHFIVTILLIVFPLSSFAGEVHFYHTDNFGTPMVMTDINGDVVWRSDELPFGEEYETIENPIKNNRRYLGKEMDEETGFIYMGSRYLNPKTGQFNRPDPVGLVDPATGKVNQEMLLNPQRLNRYAYGLNNPYRFVDSDGRNAKDIESSILNPYEMTEGGGPGRGIGASPNGATFRFRDFFKNTKSSKNSSLLKLNKKLASQEQMEQLNDGHGKAIAGAGTNTKLRDAPRLTNQHGGNASDWAKVKSSSKTHSDGYKQRTHAYENKKLNKVVEHKTKIKD